MLKLTHIAETLIAEMFNRSPEVRSSFSEVLDTDLGSSNAFFEEPLAACRDLSFDGAHRIDVALIMNSNANCIACEAKLGLDRLSML
jgi:hypothetical protein